MSPFEWLFLIGRALFAALFIGAGLGHFTQPGKMTEYAAAKGVPAPKITHLLSGIVIVLGGLSVLFWKQVVIGAWLLAGFLLLAAFMVHDFWNVDDPEAREVEMQMFMKNIALAGAAIVLYVAVQAPEVF